MSGPTGRRVWVLTHPEVQVDPAVPVTQWPLSAIGARRAAALAGGSWLDRVASVWSSTELKARECALLLAGSRSIQVREDLGENDRSATGFVPPEEFEELANAFFAYPADSARGWASAVVEQRRIVAAVEAVLASAAAGQGDVVIVSHGAVGTLLLCHLLGRAISRELDQPFQGHVFSFDRDTREVHSLWRPLEELMDRPLGRVRR